MLNLRNIFFIFVLNLFLILIFFHKFIESFSRYHKITKTFDFKISVNREDNFSVYGPLIINYKSDKNKTYYLQIIDSEAIPFGDSFCRSINYDSIQHVAESCINLKSIKRKVIFIKNSIYFFFSIGRKKNLPTLAYKYENFVPYSSETNKDTPIVCIKCFKKNTSCNI